jgi:capsular polysaccharide biosynthesis protein
VLSFIPSLDLEYDLKNKNYLFAFDQWSSGYFHWLLDTIPRIYIAIMKHSNLILLLPSELNKDLYIDSLKPFSLSDIKFIKKKGAILLRKTIYPKPLASSGNYNPDIIKNIRAIYHNHFAKGEYVDCLERIYISRSRAERRRILNEDKVFEILTRKGFTIIYAENLTFSDQCKLAMKTQVLVSNHGAGLSNMLFMNSGGKVMEIRNSSDSHNNCYFSLASALDLNYYYILADPTKKEAIPHHADLIIDEISFENQIDFMLNDKLL